MPDSQLLRPRTNDGPAYTRDGRGLGCVEMDRAHDPSYGTGCELVGAGASSVVRTSMADLVFIPPGYSFPDQESNQECVGWKMCQLVHIWCRARGIPPITPSPTGTYFGARARRYGWDGVWDGGCNPHEAFEHIAEAGIIPYDTWPHSIRKVNTNPDPNSYRKAADHKWLRPHWVRKRRTETVKGLLASQYPVGSALRIGRCFEDWRPGDEPWQRHGPIIGGHDITLVGFDHYGPRRDKVVLIGANSWGKTHGDNGFILISPEALESPETSYVCTVDIDREKMP